MIAGRRVVGEDIDRRMERWVVAPPALPLLVSPRSALGPELASAHDLGTDSGGPGARQGIVDARAPTRFSLRPLQATEGTCGEEPFVEPGTGVPKGRLVALALAGTETVE